MESKMEEDILIEIMWSKALQNYVEEINIKQGHRSRDSNITITR